MRWPTRLPVARDGPQAALAGQSRARRADDCRRGAPAARDHAPADQARLASSGKAPADRRAVVVANHISNVDPLSLGQFIAFSGRWPRFLGKASVFKVPVVGRILKACGQIPVERQSARSADALAAATAGRRRRAGGDHLPRGHDHRRPRPVADGRQDRGRPDRPADRLPGDSGRAVGGAGRDVRQRTALSRNSCPARRSR